MAAPALARVKQGINTKTFVPFWYVEVRKRPELPWSLITDGRKWLRHRTSTGAERSAKSLERRLRAKPI